jgi:hypothetical protein
MEDTVVASLYILPEDTSALGHIRSPRTREPFVPPNFTMHTAHSMDFCFAIFTYLHISKCPWTGLVIILPKNGERKKYVPYTVAALNIEFSAIFTAYFHYL